MWLVMEEKLKTRDNLRQWDVGNSIDLNLLHCPLCKVQPDSHERLFFECSFSSQVWSLITSISDMPIVNLIWNDSGLDSFYFED